MIQYLLDTNIISELSKPQPNPNIVKFVLSLDQVWLSIITIHELKYGLSLLPEGNKRTQLSRAVDDIIQLYANFIIPISDEEASVAATLRAKARKAGKSCHLADSLIAGTAKAHGLTVVSRNEKDFIPFDVDVVNPW